MDLSTGGDIDGIRAAIIAELAGADRHRARSTRCSTERKKVADIRADDLIGMLEHQAKQGVDYFTIHAGVLAEHLPLVTAPDHRASSRAAARIMAQWMIEHKQQNPFYTHWDKVLEICATLRRDHQRRRRPPPGCLADASDAAQFAELDTLGELTPARLGEGRAGHD